MILRGRRVALPDGVRPARIVVRDGTIEAVEEDGPADVDFGDAWVFPGLVDSHVHVNEPGRTHWEGFETATRAAAAGGVTTIVDMPLNSIPATTAAQAFATKLAATRGKLTVDTGFWGGVVTGNLDQLEGLHAAGVMGFKCFLAESGVDEFPFLDEAHLDAAMAELARLGALLIVHAEVPGPLEAGEAAVRAADPRAYQTYLDSRPNAAEDDAISLVIRLCRKHGTRCHIVHLSSASALPALAAAQAEGLPITAETCPHYLVFAAEDIPDGATEYKCAPPIREKLNQDALWRALDDGTLQMVVTDHSPAPPELKTKGHGAFPCAWGGISGLQFGLASTWSGLRERGGEPTTLTRWMSAGPAALVGLDGRKGRIAAGFDADLAVWDPDARFQIDPQHIHHRHPMTPHAHRPLYGVVQQTWLRGECIYREGDFPGEPRGQTLLRTTT